jgi:N-acetylgalactosamine-6-sulfatase
MNIFIRTTVLLLIVLSMNLFTACSGRGSSDPPNIIFILADDLGAGDLHCTGHPYVLSPNLDKLAEQGIRFERAYMAGAWCAPSRYGLMRGQFPARDFDRSRNLKPDEPSVTSMLHEAGYNTAHFGKWHMTKGDEYAYSPDDFGINEHFLTNYDGQANTWTKEERNEKYWRAKTTDAYVDKTIDFVKKNQALPTRKPFYVNLWIYPTHSYIYPTPEQLEVYRELKVDYADFSPYQQEFLKFVAEHGDIDQSMQAYCADVTAMDKALGRLFDFLKKEGLHTSTLVVFTSDNGPGPLTTQVISESVVERYQSRPDLLNSVGSAMTYKERKISLHDGGIRVPFIISWPGTVPGGKVDKASLIHGTDWLPTIASICGIKLPAANFDGTNVQTAFLGKRFERTKDIYWTQAGTVACLKDPWKGILNKNDEFRMYDIIKDPEERNNLVSVHPEMAENFKREILAWKKEMNLR